MTWNSRIEGKNVVKWYLNLNCYLWSKSIKLLGPGTTPHTWKTYFCFKSTWTSLFITMSDKIFLPLMYYKRLVFIGAKKDELENYVFIDSNSILKPVLAEIKFFSYFVSAKVFAYSNPQPYLLYYTEFQVIFFEKIFHFFTFQSKLSHTKEFDISCSQFLL